MNGGEDPMEHLEAALRGAARQAEPPDDLPGRFAARAAEEGLLDVAYAYVDSPLGSLLVAGTERGVVRVAYDVGHGQEILDRLAARLSPRLLEAPARLDPLRRQLDQYFAGDRREFDVPVDWTLVPPFGRRVLEATSAVPFGQVTTYADVATRAGSPRGTRAAGRALGANPIVIVVPCHRVVRTDGALAGYAGGIDRKRRLLELEGVS